MRILLAIVLLAALGWSGYWYLGKQTVEGGLRTWLDARAAEGWVVSVEDVSTTGFPNRFDTTLTGIDLADPQSGLAWRAPFLQLFALSYRPHHVIAVWPDRQSIATPFQTITMTSADMRGSMVFEPGTALALDRATIELDTVGLVSTSGWEASLDGGQLALRKTPVEQNTYDVAFQASNLMLPGRLRQALSREGLVDDALAGVSLEATVAFDAPWDRRAIEERRPQPRRIELELARATWGDLDLRMAGELSVDEQGIPTGDLTLKATNWREILELAEASGVLPSALAPMIESGLRTLARLSGNRETIDVPLSFRSGRITLGGVLPLGAAPRLILR